MNYFNEMIDTWSIKLSNYRKKEQIYKGYKNVGFILNVYLWFLLKKLYLKVIFFFRFLKNMFM